MPLCPNCESRKPNKRMRITPHYLCTECRHEFDEPFFKLIDELITTFYEDGEAIEVRDKCFISKDNWRNRHYVWQVKYWLQSNWAKTKNHETINKEAFLLYLDETIKYLSFEDTITACKKCASNFDLNNMELCPNCKEYYKGVKYPNCIQCLSEDKRIAALEKIEFGIGFGEMQNSLGSTKWGQGVIHLNKNQRLTRDSMQRLLSSILHLSQTVLHKGLGVTTQHFAKE